MRSLTSDQSQKLEFGEILNSNKKIFISADMNDADLIRIFFDRLDKNYLFIKGKIKTKLLVSEARQRLNLIEKLEEQPIITVNVWFRLFLAGIMSLISCYKLGYLIGFIPFIVSLIYSIYEIWKNRQTIKTKENCQEIVKQLSVNEADESPWTS